MAEEYINGNRRITLTVNDAIKGIIFVSTMFAVGYGVVRRMDKMEDQITVLTAAVAASNAAQSAQVAKQQKEIEDWKAATSDEAFRTRGRTFEERKK